MINLLNFLAALAGDNVRTGVTSDLKAVYGRAEEFFVNTYDNFPKKNDAQTKLFQYCFLELVGQWMELMLDGLAVQSS